jgi:hypothetical protein
MEGTYKVVEMEKYGTKLSMSVRNFRKIDKNELLIKIHCSTIHPADLMFLVGMYGDDKPNIFPMIPGFEGSGEIVGVGSNINSDLIGIRVGVTGPTLKRDSSYNGLWAEYHYTTMNYLVLFDKEIDFERITFSFINPLTAIGFLDTVKKNKAKAVVQDGANGALGRMFIRLCEKEKITTINIIRNKNQILNLKKLGADYVISTDEAGWENNLEKLSSELDAKIFFDCIGGRMSGKILSLLPKESIMYNFGNLDIKNVAVDSTSLIFKEKKVQGWWLPSWLRQLNQKEYIKWTNYVSNDIKIGSDLFLTKISKDYQLNQINEAIKFYIKNMSEGKIILRPKF